MSSRKGAFLEITLTPQRWSVWTGTITAGLVALGAGELAAFDGEAQRGWAHSFARMVDLDREQNLPTAWSCLLMASCGIAAGVTWAARRRRGLPRLGWLALAILMAYAAADEFVSIHEAWSEPLAQALGTAPGTMPKGWLHYSWIIAGAIAALAVGMAFVPFLRALPPTTALGLLGGGCLFILGAVGLETIEGAFVDFRREAALVQETMELAGLWLASATLLHHVSREAGPLAITLRPDAAENTAEYAENGGKFRWSHDPTSRRSANPASDRRLVESRLSEAGSVATFDRAPL